MRPHRKTLKRETAAQFARFVLVGLINTAFGYAVYAGLVLLGLPPQWALALSFAIGVLWNYVTTARFVFRVSGFGKLPAYIACYVSVYAANALALGAAIKNGVAPLLAQAALTPVAAVLTFVLLSLVMREADDAA